MPQDHLLDSRKITDGSRVLLTYAAPIVITGCAILWGLWIVPDELYGMYANVDGKWTSWSARAILEWSSFLDFGPYSPLHGAGSMFTPNLPWLAPGGLALGLPVSIEYRYLISYIVYLAELTISLYFLFLELDIKKEYAVTAVLLYVSFFFPPFNVLAPTWYSLGPFLCNVTAALNLATIALLRCGLSSRRHNLLWGVVFAACVFIGFSTAPIFFLTFVPAYGTLWGLVAFSSQADRRAIPVRIGAIVSTLAVFLIIGVPGYIFATASVSARDTGIPPFLHPGMALLTVKYWTALFSKFETCSGQQAYFLICPSKAPAAWIQIAALVGGCITIVFDKGRRRTFAIAIVSMTIFIHFYFLLGMDYVLGRVHIVGFHYISWTMFPLVFGVAVAGAETVCRLGSGSHLSAARWIPAVGNTAISIIALVYFVNFIAVRQPRMPGEGPLGFPPIAHGRVHKGDIHRYLEGRIALAPGKVFNGYAGLHLDPDDGFVRKLGPLPDGVTSHELYVDARSILRKQFGNSFQLTDLWDSSIPTLEDYGQWLTKQMYILNRDLLARPEDKVDPTGVATHVYRLFPTILAALGVRYIVSDGILTSPLVTEVMQEKSAAGSTLRLYEIGNANIGNYSPTDIVYSESYNEAITKLRNWQADTVVLSAPAAVPAGVVPATDAKLVVTKGGYRVTARSAGTSLLVLPVQFSHCWELVERSGAKASIFRANIAQTGIRFEGKIDAELRFGFGLTQSGCRKRDGGDMSNLR